MSGNTRSYNSNSLDRSEDDQFRGYKDIEKGNEIIQIENDEEQNLDDDYKQAVIQMNNYFSKF